MAPVTNTPKRGKPGCADCYFKRNGLCALAVEDACATFRHVEDGLRPPSQLSFVFRQERVNTAWAFKPAALSI